MAGFFNPPTSRRPDPASAGPVVAPLPPVPHGRPSTTTPPRKLTFRQQLTETFQTMSTRVRARVGRVGVGVAGVLVLVVAAALVGWTLHAAARNSPAAVGSSGATATSAPLATLPLISRTGPSVPAGTDTGTSGGAADVASGSAPGSTVGAASASTTGPAATIAVHAAGAVIHPGVYVFAEGARVDDVIGAAGGLRPDADPDVINLAARVRDAERVFVPRVGRTVPAVQTGTATAPTDSDAIGADPAAPGGPVDLNTATVAQLDALPGVGPATAAAIIEFRRVHGRFRTVAQLLDVTGIGDAKFAALRPKVTVSA